MNDKLYYDQMSLEREMRDRSISKFLKDHSEGNFDDTITGRYLIYNYIIPIMSKLEDYLESSKSGKAGRRHRALTFLSMLPCDVTAFLAVKGILNKLPVLARDKAMLTVTSYAIYIGSLIHNELRIRKFEEDHKAWLDQMFSDFDRRELPRYKRLEYLQKTTKDAGEEWSIMTEADKLHVGLKLLETFREVTGDITYTNVKKGRHSTTIVQPSEGLLRSIERIKENTEDLCVTWYPTIIPPVPWSAETLSKGGYHSHHVTPYPLVKNSRRDYRELLRDKAEVGGLEISLTAINAIQETPWRVNRRVLDALNYVYTNNIECGKLPRADNKDLDPAPEGFDLWAKDDPRRVEYMRYRATIHEYNRRSIGKRVLTLRALHMAERFAKYDRIYFPHDLDSRGRAYPKPNPLNPQGPDYVKGLLEFADGKLLGRTGLYWLGVHGANCYGEDKLPIAERAAWAEANIEAIKATAANPEGYLWWTEADNPVQFLAFCFEYAAAFDRPNMFVSHLHVDLDATCSGLQHFSAMLRDEVGGFHVNMTAHPARQDVYGAVAKEAIMIFHRDAEQHGDNSQMARAWIDSDLMDRKVSKRPVMVKPYAGTMNSCMSYVRSAVDDKLLAGHPLPWAKDDMFNFKVYGGKVVWEAIPKVVVAADEAMRWLSSIARAVGRSQPDEKRIEWTTPVGFPVWQYKFDLKSRQIKTKLDGSIFKPRLVEETDRLDSRQMGSSVAPSFVHSLDAAHLQLTTTLAVESGITHFAMVHDSFGVHAADVPVFSRIIREAFVEMYQYDVLSDFLESARPFMSVDEFEKLDPIPDKGNLDLDSVLQSEFFFS